jgi:hypothetical protein
MALFSHQVPYWTTTGIVSQLTGVMNHPEGLWPDGVYYVASETTSTSNDITYAGGVWVIVQNANLDDPFTYQSDIGSVKQNTNVPEDWVGIGLNTSNFVSLQKAQNPLTFTAYAYVYRFV